VREYDLEGLPTHNEFEKDVQDLLKNHESIGWERRDYKQACAAGPGDGMARQKATRCALVAYLRRDAAVQEAVIEQIKKKYYECMTERRCAWAGWAQSNA
jgi:hypothetical protein